jgi:choline dehydrogenase-like flavoprotein
MPHFMYRCYVAARDHLPRRAVPHSYVVVYFCEQPPDPASRVTLSHDTDRLGMNRLHLHWHIGDSVLRSLERLQAILRQRIEAAGIGRLEEAHDVPAFTDASHHMGTTRMSAAPGTGVVDTDCRVHGMENLYIAGSSVFPSAGYANPTLTIVALALRLAAHIHARQAK